MDQGNEGKFGVHQRGGVNTDEEEKELVRLERRGGAQTNR